MFRLLCFGMTVLATVVVAGKTFVPIKILYAAVPFFPSVDFCNRVCYSSYKMLPNNVRFVTFGGKLNPGETPKQLGDCIKIYIDQTNWLKGATTEITSDGENATLEITGTPDPTYDPNATPDSSFDTPLELTGEIFNAFPDADLAGCRCDLSSHKDPCGCVHCVGKCTKYPNDNRTPDQVLEDAFNYFNQVGLVERCHKHSSLLDDGRVFIEFVGNSIPDEDGNICAPQ